MTLVKVSVLSAATEDLSPNSDHKDLIFRVFPLIFSRLNMPLLEFSLVASWRLLAL